LYLYLKYFQKVFYPTLTNSLIIDGVSAVHIGDADYTGVRSLD